MPTDVCTQAKSDARRFGIKEINILKASGYKVEEMRYPYYFRIEGVIDVYPTGRRYHYLPTNERGSYHDLHKTLKIYDIQRSGSANIWEMLKAPFITPKNV